MEKGNKEEVCTSMCMLMYRRSVLVCVYIGMYACTGEAGTYVRMYRWSRYIRTYVHILCIGSNVCIYNQGLI